MALEIASPTPSPGAWLFIRHAFELLLARRRDPGPAQSAPDRFWNHAAMVSAVMRFSSCDDEITFSPQEREGLVFVLGVARDLAVAAKLDPRWPSLRVTGDPRAELERLRGSLERVPSCERVILEFQPASRAA